MGEGHKDDMASAFAESMRGVRCAVTGGSGFVGQRLVEMALARGAALVVSFDVSPRPMYGPMDTDCDSDEDVAALVAKAEASGRLVYQQGDITRLEDVERMVMGGGNSISGGDAIAVDIVYHVAALVGPFHKEETYIKVNCGGTANVIEACKRHGVSKIVMSSSPSTRFDPWNLDITGLREEELMFPDERTPPRKFVAEYAKTKAMGERLLRSENGSKLYTSTGTPSSATTSVNGRSGGSTRKSGRIASKRSAATSSPSDHEGPSNTLLTVAVAPHQVYGPRDGLFLPNLLNAAGTGKLRIFGRGENRISMTHVDNYCHALLLAGSKLEPGSTILGKFYIATDGGSYRFWGIIDEAIIAMGYTSLWSKMHLPVFLLLFIAQILNVITMLTGRKFKLNEFTVKMLIIDRYFDIGNIEQDMGYKPIVNFESGWASTIEWFQKHWLSGGTRFSAQPPR